MINLSIIIPIGRHENDFKLIKQIKQKFKGCEIILVVDEENKLINQEKIEVDQLYLLFLRLSPIFPFFLINLTFGLTQMKWTNFYWISQ